MTESLSPSLGREELRRAARPGSCPRRLMQNPPRTRSTILRSAAQRTGPRSHRGVLHNLPGPAGRRRAGRRGRPTGRVRICLTACSNTVAHMRTTQASHLVPWVIPAGHGVITRLPYHVTHAALHCAVAVRRTFHAVQRQCLPLALDVGDPDWYEVGGILGRRPVAEARWVRAWVSDRTRCRSPGCSRRSEPVDDRGAVPQGGESISPASCRAHHPRRLPATPSLWATYLHAGA
jgi:hypothetical protein